MKLSLTVEDGFNVLALGRELKDGNLVVGADHFFTDALTGTSILDGCILQEIRIDDGGVPVAVARSGDSIVREKCVYVSSQPAPAIGATGLSGFLGNRVAALGLRVSVPELTAAGGRVQAIFAIGSQMADLGVLGPGLDASVQVDLDPFLRDKTGIAYGTITLSVPAGIVGTAVVQCDVTRADGGVEVMVASVKAAIHGNQAALLLPYYGIDAVGKLAASIEGSAEHYLQYQSWATQCSGDGSAAPSQIVVANGLIGLDASPASLAAGLQALVLLGHNTIEAWGFDGMPSGEIVASAGTAGFQRFRYSVYRPGWAPGGIFKYEPALSPAQLESWATWLKTQIEPTVTSLDRLALFHMADEPGWYYPFVSDEVGNKPDYLTVFHQYLERESGLTAPDFGAVTFDLLKPGTLSQATAAGATVESKRLLFWTTRFYAQSASEGFAAATRTLRGQLNDRLLITANCGIGRFFTPSPNQKIANNPDSGPDAAMGAPDWFDLGRRRAVTCLWTEDWFADQSAQIWSYYGDMLRCAAANGKIAFGGYVVGVMLATQPQAIPDGASYKIMALAGRGAQAVDLFSFGQLLQYGDSWSDDQAVYGPVARALQLLGKAERLRGEPGKMRRGTVALLFPQASQVWDPGQAEYSYFSELSGLHGALIHAQYPVDFVDDVDVEKGALAERGYKVLYVSAPNLSDIARKAILLWVSSGGTLVLLPGACCFDCYDQPADDVTAAAGAQSAPVPRLPVPHGQDRLLLPKLSITRAVDIESFPAETTVTPFKVAPYCRRRGRKSWPALRTERRWSSIG